MSNPFVDSGLLLAERERGRRENVRVGVYAVLVTASLFLAGLLIQGCRGGQTTNEAANAEGAVSPANLPNPVLVTEGKQSETNSAAPREAAAAASTLPSAAPVPSSLATPAPAPLRDTPAPEPEATEAIYLIKPGDSLVQIAKTHGTTVAALKAANKLKSDRIIAGKKLKLPQPALPVLPAVQG